MSTQLMLVLALLAAAIAMFALNRPRMDAVALIMLVLLPFVGRDAQGEPIVAMREALAGFSDPNIVLIAALFVLGAGLVRTGVATRVGDWLIARTGSSEARLLALLMLAVCTIGAFMSSTAVTAIFIPVALRIAQSTGAAPGRLMMPLSFAALISGMMTLVATAPNLVVNAELVRQEYEGFHFFAFTPFGIPVLILGILYMFVARRWLPADDPGKARRAARPTLQRWIEDYGLSAREFRLRITAGSSLVGRPLGELDLRSSAGINILAVERSGRGGTRLIRPSRGLELEAGDVLLVDRLEGCETLPALAAKYSLEPLELTGAYFNDRSQDLGMAEVIVPDDSDLIGQTVVDARFRTRTHLTLIGLRRGAEVVRGNLADERIRVGDTLLVLGSWNDLERLDPEDAGVALLRLPVEVEEVLPAPGKAVQAVACLALVIVLMVWGIIPNVQAALIGCLLMGLFGCIDLPSAYRAIDWKTIVLIVGMMPFSLALQRTGGVELAADAVVAMSYGTGIRVVLAAIFVITTVLGMFMSNTATAILMAPVAIAVAREMGASPHPFAMIVALAASTAFVTPVSSPVNTLVVTPGNYSFSDFVKIGGPFAVVVMVFAVLVVPILLPP